ncbi:MAG: hypothetical protein NT094_04345 [Candidatus Staskawiczbacteria bacterium]|nr:hypothetical protein [Candidatus Staskawiczbacteria bacterium]
MKSISDISKILNEKIEKIIWALGLHAFLLILFLIIVDVVLGGFIFYKNVFLAEKEIPNTTQNIIKFNEKKYQDVSEKLNTTEQSIKEPLATDQSDTTLQVVTPIVTTSPYIFSGYLSYGSKRYQEQRTTT